MAPRSLTELDAVGNTTKAITKGIAIATAVLAATALFGSYTDAIHTVLADNYNKFIDQAVVFAPQTLVGLLIGAAVVFLFSGLAISAVGRAAGAVVFEVRRQFREIPGIMDGTGKPEYGKVVDICTKDSLARAGDTRTARHLCPDRRRIRPRRLRAGRVPRRCHRDRHLDGCLPGQLGRCLGQREEAG